ncbi:MAG: hypothetical protein AAGJ32_07140 [Pseudomonadota bacterium]
MPRDVDERKKRRALRKLRKAADMAEQGLGPPLSDWEQSFLEELEERIETYGSAFADPTKGDLSEPLSALQQRKLKEIDKKARGKAKPQKDKPRNGLNARQTNKTNKTKLASKTPRAAAARAENRNATKPSFTKPRLVRASDLSHPPLRDHEHLPADAAPKLQQQEPQQQEPQTSKAPESPKKRPAFRVIEGGKTD